MNPTFEQQNIVNFFKTNSDNLAIIAAPGSGKTSTLGLIANSLPNSKIMTVAFNTSVVYNMRKVLPKNAFCFSFHQLGNALCRAHYNGGFILMDDEKEKRNKYNFLFHQVMKDAGENPKTKQFWANLAIYRQAFDMCRLNLSDFSEQSIRNICAQYMIEYSGLMKQYLPEVLNRGIQQAGFGKKGKTYFWDQTDTVFLPAHLDLYPKEGMKIGNKDYSFSFASLNFILSDEAQDYTECQISLIKKFGNKKTQFTFVGDPLQSINAWAGAKSNSMEIVSNEFDCEQLPLSVCFRCPSNHVAMINNLFETNMSSVKSDGIINRIGFDEIASKLSSDTMILTRNVKGKNSSALKLFFDCLRQGIVLNVAGLDIKGTIAKTINNAVQEKLENDLEFEWKNVESELTDYVFSIPAYKRGEVSEDVSLCNAFIQHFQPKSFIVFQQQLTSLTENNYNAPKITTIHRAKGSEAQKVIILDWPNFPYTDKRNSDEQNAQEYNIWYVAASRSQNELNLVM